MIKLMDPSLAEQHLCSELVSFLKKVKQNENGSLRILDIGAGQSVTIENNLSDNGCDYMSDRIDIVDTTVDHPFVDKCMSGSIESMTPVESGAYHAAFANYVLEFVTDFNEASREIYRILKPSGIFLATLPNTTAPECIIARLTPIWFHRIVRRSDHNYEPVYAYRSIQEIVNTFESNGFKTLAVTYYPHVELYLRRFSSILAPLGKVYDTILTALKINALMGSACIIFEKSS